LSYRLTVFSSALAFYDGALYPFRGAGKNGRAARVSSHGPVQAAGLAKLAMIVRPLLAAAALCAFVTGLGYWKSESDTAARRLTAWESRQADERLHALLDAPYDWHGAQMPLEEFAGRLSALTGIEVQIDDDITASGEGAGPRTPISLPHGSVPLHTAATSALGSHWLTYEIRGGRLLITTREAVESTGHLILETYALPQPSLTAGQTDEAEWAEVIQCTIGPIEWERVGGPNYIQSVPGGLVVMAPRDLHQQIRAFLRTLGDAENPPASWKPLPYPGAATGPVCSRIYAVLDQPFSIDEENLPLREFAAVVARQGDIPVYLDDKKLAEAGVGTSFPITARYQDIPLRSALRLVLDDLELTFVVRDEMLLITTPEEAESCLWTLAYPVHDLVAMPGGGSDFDSVGELIITTVAPHSWDEVGGPGSYYSIAGGWLIFSQTQEVHSEIEELLAMLRRALWDGGPGPYPISSLSLAEQQIAAALDREILLVCNDLPLAEVCRELSARLGINVRLDIKRLEQAGVDSDQRITCNYAVAPASMQLERVLEPLELDCVIRDDVLQITTPEEAESRLVQHLYDVRPLTDPDLGLADVNGLVDLITETVAEQSWDEVGGPGSISEFRGLFVVSQFSDVHREIAALLNQLETHCLPRMSPSPDSPQVVRTIADPAEEQIEAALTMPITLEGSDVPLADIVRQLADLTGVPIVLDPLGLKKAGFSTDVHISVAASHTTFAAVLEQLTQPLKLRYGFWNRQLVISDPERCEDRLTARLYWAGDLLQKPAATPEALVDRIQGEVEPAAWDQAGGLCTIASLRTGWLVVSADTIQHEHLADWLHEQRTGQKTQRARERAAAQKKYEEALSRLHENLRWASQLLDSPSESLPMQPSPAKVDFGPPPNPFDP
jgi:hypothetical protein